MTDNSQAMPTEVPLTQMQQGMLFASLEAGAGAGVYVEQAVASFPGRLDSAALETAWKALIARHDALRLAFAWRGRDRAVQAVQEGVAPRMAYHDWSDVSANSFEMRLARFLEEDRQAGIDLEHAPLHRATALSAPGGTWRMVWTIHHAIIDGRGIAAVLREFVVLYRAATGKIVAPTWPPPGSFAEFAAQEAEIDWTEAAAFWKGALAGVDEPVTLPLAAPLRAECAVGEVEGEIGAREASALRALAAEVGVTTGTLVHAAWGLLLHRYTGCDTVVFGATRALPGGAAVGLHINTLPMVARIDRARPVRAWLAELRADWLAQRSHTRAPLAYVQQWALGSGAMALFDTYTMHERGTLEDLMLRGADAEGVSVALHERTPSPLTLAIYERDAIEIHIEFDARRFSATAIQRMLAHFEQILAALPAHVDRPLGEVPMLLPGERAALVRAAPPAPPFEPVHAAIACRAMRWPKSQAVVHRETVLDYAALERRANQIAHALQVRGVQPRDVVAFALPRCAEAIETILGTLKAGAAYLPIDLGLPAERRAFMLSDSAARLTVTLRAGDALGPVLALRDEADFIDAQPTETPRHVVQANDPAYVIYTSGSTGQPKGVVVPHGALAAFVAGARQLYRITRRDRVLQFASFSFDAAAEEIYPTLAVGATLVLRNDEMIASAPGFIEQCRAWDITVLDLPTAYWHVVVDSLDRIKWPRHLRLVIIGGEAARPDKVRTWCAHIDGRVRLANTYGPTETTVAVTCAFLETEADGAPVPIGVPFPFASAYVVDAQGEPVPDGVPGELWIGGPQLALGYLNREELTAKVFIPAPWDLHPEMTFPEQRPGETPGATGKVYRTGDRVYRREDGALVYLERVDRQVKLRGFRIELGEIEAVLRGVEGVAEAAVVLREDQPGLPMLCAYIAVPGGDAEAVSARAREHVAAALPGYMQPTRLITIDAMPMTTSGKIDRKALPCPRQATGQDAARPPRTALEGQVHEIWCLAFGARALGCDDEFLSLGGHSLLAAQISARVAAEMGVTLPLAFFSRQATIAKLAAHLENAPRVACEGIPRLPEGEVARLAPDQELLWVYERIYPGTSAYHIPVAFEVRGPLDLALLERALEVIVLRHDALRSTFGLVDDAAAIQVAPHVRIPWRIERVEAIDDEMARTWLAREATQSFQIETGPLLRVAVLGDAANSHVVCLTLHHLIGDGWSVGILAREWSAAYAAVSRGETPVFPALPVRYVDVAAWRRARERAPGGVAEHFWRTQLAPPVPRFAWPARAAGGVPAATQGAQYPVHFPRALSDDLVALARAQGATPFAVFFALLAIALHRFSGQSDMMIGFSLAARSRAEFEGSIGFFIATLLLRVNTAPEKRFDVFLREVRDGLWEAQEHQDYSLARLRALDSAGHADPSAPPLLQALILMQSMPLPPLEIEGATTRTLNVDLGGALTDITLELYPSREGFTGWIEYQTALFDRVEIARLISYLERLAECVVAAPFEGLDALPKWDECAAPAELAPAAPLRAAPPPARMEINRVSADDTNTGPPDEHEVRLLALFERVLRERGLDVRSNFFEHGGHSLLAILLLDHIEREFGVRLAPVDVYQAPTVRALSRRMRGTGEHGLTRVVEHIRPAGTRTPLFFVGSTDMVPPLLPYLEPAQPVYGLNIFGLLPDSGPVPRLTVPGIAAAYVGELRRVQPKGPYRLAAYCRDTMLALEVAQQLYAAGEVVDRLIVIDFFWESSPRYPKPIRHVLNLYEFGTSYVHEKLREAFRQVYEWQARLRARLALRRRAVTATPDALPHNHRNTAFISAYYEAVEQYEVAAYPGHVYAVLVSEWGISSLPEWDDLAEGGTTLHILKACHYNLWNPPQDRDLADVLNACLADLPDLHGGDAGA